MRSQTSDTSGHSLANCKACRQCGRSKPIQAYISKNKAFICLICDTCRMNQRRKSRGGFRCACSFLENYRIRKMQRAITSLDNREICSDGWIYRPISVSDDRNIFLKPAQERGEVLSIIDSVIPTARWVPSTLKCVETGQSTPIVATAVSHCTLLNSTRN